jgi:hypothetical protein
MRNLNFLILLPGLITSVLLAISGAPLFLRLVPRNQWIGFRFKKSFESDELWFQINEYGGKQMILCSILIVVLSLTLAALESKKILQLPQYAHGLAPLLPIAWMLFSVFKFSAKLS